MKDSVTVPDAPVGRTPTCRGPWPVATGIRSGGPTTVIGHCTCGWYGPERQLVVDAYSDLMLHLEIA